MIWHTYTEPRARQIEFVLREFIKAGLLTEDEEEAAKRLLRQFRGSPKPGQKFMLIYVAEEHEPFLMRLEESLYRSKVE